jgi:hypothetical protein
MIRYYLHSHNYLEVTRCYRAIYESPLVAGDAAKWKPVSAGLLDCWPAWLLACLTDSLSAPRCLYWAWAATTTRHSHLTTHHHHSHHSHRRRRRPLAAAAPPAQVLQKICWYIVLSPSYSTAQGTSGDALTLLTTTLADKQLGDLPAYKQLLQTLVNQEIIPWGQFQAQYAPETKAQAEVFGGEDAAKRAADLKLRIIEHNLQVRAAAGGCRLRGGAGGGAEGECRGGWQWLAAAAERARRAGAGRAQGRPARRQG